MKVTNEILKRFGLQFKDGIDSMEFFEFILRYYGEYPINLFHYINNYYRLSEEEFGLYCAVFQIKDSSNFWNCFKIENSKNLFNSFSINDSNFIRNSSQVMNSTDIFNSIVVLDSKDVAHSNCVKRSRAIIESQNIDNSDNIARSNNISWSSVILNSSNLSDCSYTYMSQDLVDCHFCGFTKNSRHCLFCVGLENKEYYIFNKPVTQMEYEMVKEKLLSLLEEEQSKMIKVNESKHTAEERFKLNRRFDTIFEGLSSEFYGWVGTLPNYSDNTFVDLFFRDREIKKVEK